MAIFLSAFRKVKADRANKRYRKMGALVNMFFTGTIESVKRGKKAQPCPHADLEPLDKYQVRGQRNSLKTPKLRLDPGNIIEHTVAGSVLVQL